MIKKYAEWEVPEIPEPLPMIEHEGIQVAAKASLFENLGEPIISEKPLVFETTEMGMFNQGIALY